MAALPALMTNFFAYGTYQKHTQNHQHNYKANENMTIFWILKTWTGNKNIVNNILFSDLFLESWIYPDNASTAKWLFHVLWRAVTVLD